MSKILSALILFFRAGFVYSLNIAADFADMIGESIGCVDLDIESSERVLLWCTDAK